jgi:hypothetical protein
MSYVAPKELAGIVTEVPASKDIAGSADAVREFFYITAVITTTP